MISTNWHFVLIKRDSTSTLLTPKCQLHQRGFPGCHFQEKKTLAYGRGEREENTVQRKKRLGENVKGQRQSNFSVMLSSYCRTTGACRSFQFIATHNCDVIWGPGLTQDRDILNKHWHKTENSPDFKLKRKLQQRKKRREERVHRHKKWFRRHQ